MVNRVRSVKLMRPQGQSSRSRDTRPCGSTVYFYSRNALPRACCSMEHKCVSTHQACLAGALRGTIPGSNPGRLPMSWRVLSHWEQASFQLDQQQRCPPTARPSRYERRGAISGGTAACSWLSNASTLLTIYAGSILQAIRSSHPLPSATSWYTLTVARWGVLLSDWNKRSSALTMRSPIGTSLTSNQRRRPLSCRNPLWWASPVDSDHPLWNSSVTAHRWSYSGRWIKSESAGKPTMFLI
jgi:hypothetical protein